MLNVKEEKRARKENGTMELDYLLPAKNGFLEAGVPNSSGGVILESMSKDTGEALFTLTSLHCFKSLLGSGNVRSMELLFPSKFISNDFKFCKSLAFCSWKLWLPKELHIYW
jgi:hypothetical protein